MKEYLTMVLVSLISIIAYSYVNNDKAPILANYAINIINYDGVTIVSEFKEDGSLVVRDTIMIDSLSNWILKDNL